MKRKGFFLGPLHGLLHAGQDQQPHCAGGAGILSKRFQSHVLLAELRIQDQGCGSENKDQGCRSKTGPFAWAAGEEATGYCVLLWSKVHEAKCQVKDVWVKLHF